MLFLRRRLTFSSFRSYCATQTCTPGAKLTPEGCEVKPKKFEDIPGPKSVPVIGTLYKYTPFFGEYTFNNLYENARKRYEKYGPIVKETILPGVDVVHIFHPDDIETVLRYSGKYPERRSHVALANYRRSKPDVYSSVGLLASNGSEWHQIRSVFQKYISSPKSAAKYINLTNIIVDEFIQRIDKLYAKRGTVKDFSDELSRLNLQLIGIIAFDVKIDCFSEKELDPESFSSKLIELGQSVNDIMFRIDTLPPLLHTLRNPVYKKAFDCFSYLEVAALKFISNKMAADVTKDGDLSLLEQYFQNPNITKKDIIGISTDVLLAGFDTTTHTTSFALFHLAKNPTVQQKLYEESLQLLPNIDDTVTTEVISKAPYLKACLKEVLRKNPISIGIGRTLTQDIVLSGYKVPKGTVAVTNNQVLCDSKDHFDNPELFLPERWMKESEHFKNHHPFLSIPFGHGSRMCIARRLAEQNMYITILKLVRNFKLKWIGNDLKIQSLSLNKPDGAINVIFERRTD